MSAIPVQSQDVSANRLTDLLKQFITLGVSCIGFLFIVRKSGYGGGLPGWCFYLTLVGFTGQVLFALLGQMAVVFKPSAQKQGRCAWLIEPNTWFLATWVMFCVGVSPFVIVLFAS